MSIDVEALKSSVDIVSVIGSYVDLKKRGHDFIGLCPFHNDRSPSFYVVPGKRIYHCFSCDASGDVIDFLQEQEGVDFKGACERLGAPIDWRPRVPIMPEATTEPGPERITSKPPPDATRPELSIRGLGAPSKTYEIRDVDGGLIAYECRYETESKKEIRIWSWGTRGDQPPRWGVGHCNAPRPLYGLDRLKANPGATVLITEGPKKADAGAKLLPSYASLSITGGAKGWHKHDYTPIAGRAILLIPDNDEPGIHAGQKLAELLADPRGLACRVRIVDPTGQPEGWDIADALSDGWDTEKLIAWAKPRAKDYHHIVERQSGDPQDQPPLEAYAEEASRAAPRQAEPVKKVNGRHVLGEVFYRSMADIEAKPISWLWPGRIAKGKVSMIVGNPGLGKSQVCASIASVVSNGGAWPVERTKCDLGSVVILSAEDDPEDTIRPRLEAAEADLSKIFILDAIRVERDEGEGKRGFDLSVDIPRLAALLQDLQDPALVIIDPITAYLGDADSHKNAEVRALLAPLAEMAASKRVAVIAVSHLTKSSGMDALLRVQGSIGFAAAARAVWGVAKDKDNPSRRLFMPLKNNLGTDISGFAYSVEGIQLQESDIQTSHVMWENQIITISTDEVFGQGEQNHEERSEILDAKMYLRALLADGPVQSKLVEVDAKGAGHAWSTIRRAQKELGVHVYRGDGIGSQGKWYWKLNA